MTNQIKSSLIVSLPYLIVIAISYLIVVLVIRSEMSGELYYDAGQYNRIAEFMRERGLFVGNTRTYGYPVFLNFVYLITPNTVNFTDGVGFIQFLLHIVTALATVYTLSKLAERAGFSLKRWHRLVCFALIQLNPLLLAMTQEVLTDSITVLGVTVFLVICMARVRYQILLVALVIAILTIIRPFHLNWSIAFFALWAGLFVFGTLINSTFKAHKEFLDTHASKIFPQLLMGAFILLIILSVQLWRVYTVDREFNLVTQWERDYIPLHLTETTFVYKYETYVGEDNTLSATVYYINEARQIDGEFSIGDTLRRYAEDPLGAFNMITGKTIGLFQNYEWSVYRQTRENPANHPVFFAGLLLFTAFLYINQHFILNYNRQMAINASFLAVFVLINSYIFLYSILTVPESRFIYPVFPALTAGMMFILLKERDIRPLFYTFVIATTLYILIYQVLLETMV